MEITDTATKTAAPKAMTAAANGVVVNLDVLARLESQSASPANEPIAVEIPSAQPAAAPPPEFPKSTSREEAMRALVDDLRKRVRDKSEPSGASQNSAASSRAGEAKEPPTLAWHRRGVTRVTAGVAILNLVLFGALHFLDDSLAKQFAKRF